MCAFRNDIHKGSAVDTLLNKGKTHKQTDQKNKKIKKFQKSSESGLIAHITKLGAILVQSQDVELCAQGPTPGLFWF